MTRSAHWLRLLPLTLFASFTAACTSPFNQTESRRPASVTQEDGLEWMSVSDNAKIWDQYCSAPGGAGSTDVPQPNYKNKKVKAAAEKFRTVAKTSFYMYTDILNAYGIRDVKDAPKGVTPQAHTYLIYLCGEFRDRASMIEAKLNWIGNFNKLAAKPQPPVPAKSTKNVWMLMTAPSYKMFLQFSHDLWFARFAQITKVALGSYNENRPVDGMTVCVTKFMFNEISKLTPETGILVPFSQSGSFDLKAFDTAFNEYKKDCPERELKDYYDFRGDSNFKPNSPEGNGMIWYANHVAGNCASTKKARVLPSENVVTNPGNIITDAVCEDYFKNPFRRRWQAARAGLSSWMMHSKDHDNAFRDDYSGILIWPHRITSDDATQRPFAFKVPAMEGFTEPLSEWLTGFDALREWNKNDFGFNEAAGLGSSRPDHGFAFERLRDAMNRHTNWYQSKWDDGLGGKRSFKEQAYSPFVASSYEPSESDQFTFCGVTVPCDPDGYKHWMFVFRVKGENWYGSDDLGANEKIDFSRSWFDETSLGTTSLADKEHAWDRLGTALEEELEGGAILYLHNITDTGLVADDGLN